MRRHFLYIILLVLIAGFLVWPKIGMANENEIYLTNEEEKLILNTVQKKLKQEEILMFADPDVDLAAQTSIFLIQRAVQKEMFLFFFVEVPKEVTKDLIKATFKIIKLIIYTEDISGIIEEIEKISVEKAKEYLIDHLLKNEIKTANGNLDYSYTSYKGTPQRATFQYIITHQYLEKKQGKVAIEFYSSHTIEPPGFAETTLRDLNRDLEPFILRIKGKVENFYGAYIWVEEPEIEPIFNEPVPEFVFEEPGFFDKLKSSFNEKIIALKKIEEKIDSFGGIADKLIKDITKIIFDKIGSIFSNINPFTAKLAPGPLFGDLDFYEINLENLRVPEEKLEEITKKQEELKELVKELEIEKPQLTLAEIQEIIDDITERVDVLSQEVAKLIVEEARPEPEVEEVEEESAEVGQVEIGQGLKEEQREEPKEEVEEKPKEIRIGNIGSVVLPSYCQRSADSQASRDKVIINEISWMGTVNSSNNEWLELKNITNSPINLAGWQLLDKEQQIKIIFKEGNLVPANGFYLLERTDDDSVPNISADFIYKGALNDTNEALYLFDDGCQLQDQVEALPDWLTGNKEEKRSMERDNVLGWYTYLGGGENGIMGTPKRENSLPTEAPQSEPEPGQPTQEQSPVEEQPAEEQLTDTTPPEVVFNLESVQTTLSFTISWTAEDPVGNTTPSGIDVFYLQYETPSIETTSPSIEEAIISVLWYQDDSEEWQDWSIGEVLELGAEKDNLQVLGKDEYTYHFKIQVSDKAGNLSNRQEASFTINLSKTILINEVQIDSQVGKGGVDDDWVELYNPNEKEIDLSQWSIQRSPSSGKVYEKHFEEGHKIPAKGYFLIVRNNARQELLDIADMTCSALQLSSDSTVYLVRNQDDIEGGDDHDIVDKVGFGEKAFSPEGNPAPEPPEAKSIERKELGLDTNDNSQDFEINEVSTPTNSKGETILPEPISEAPWPMFQHDSQRTGSSPFVGPGILEAPQAQVLVEADEGYFSFPLIGPGNILYVEAGINGRAGIYAFYPDGTEKWYYPTELIYTGFPVITKDGSVYFFIDTCQPDRYQNISPIMLNPDGSLKWEKSPINMYPVGHPVIGDDGTIYFLANVSDSAKLIALNPDSGDFFWTYDIEGNIWQQNPAIGKDDGTIYFGDNDTLYAINPDGTEKWKRKFEPDCRYFVCEPQVGAPSIGDDGTIYVMVASEKDFQALTDEGSLACLHAINPENKQDIYPPNCSKLFDPRTLTISSNNNLYFPGGGSPAGQWLTYLFGFDSGGKDLPNWPLFLRTIGRANLLIVDKEEIIYGVFGRTLRAFDKDGSQKWEISLPTNQPEEIISVDGEGNLYIGGSKKLLVIKAKPR